MRTTIYAAAMAATVLGMATMAPADDTGRTWPASSATTRAAAPRPRATNAQAIAGIREARDPSAAVEAYSRARAVTTRPVAVAQAYVRRMTEFGLPEMAESQAKAVLEEELSDPLAKAVIAAIRAQRGDADGAVAGIATAVKFGPEEPFVRRTAGQILAWHDTRSGSMAEDLESTIETMRRSVASTPECAESYRAACRAYLTARAAKAETPKPPATLVADSVPAEFEDEDGDFGVIYTAAAIPCDGTWDYWSPRSWGAWCSTPWRGRSLAAFDAARCGGTFASRRSSWGGYGFRGASYLVGGRPYTQWSTPLGSYSRSVPSGGWCAPRATCAPEPSCAPRRGGRSYGHGWHR